MSRKLSKRTISGLMADWGRKGGSRATEAQKNAARANLKKTPNYQKHAQFVEAQIPNLTGRATSASVDAPARGIGS